MEFINHEREHKRLFNLYVSSLDKDALKKAYTSSSIYFYEHEMDNSFIHSSYGKTINNMRSRGYQILGIGNAPYVHQGQNLAVVFEDMETFTRYWCHLSQSTYEWWLEQAEKQ